MYGYVSDSNNTAASGIFLDEGEEFEQLIAEYPEHEVYLFAGTDVDVALFVAPGVSAMLIEERASPDKSF
jgi:hypothetical protein